ncbi:MAG: 4Fe-4S dicluster domain-containing protein, partial [Polyangiaceae bacterium]|nr:4Fe-4S dicluster domain-containing protein [Polyangiaceae bacterium]
MGLFSQGLLAACANSDQPNHSTPKRWAMVVDTRKCSAHEDCTLCIDACHLAHNVPTLEKSSTRAIRWIKKSPFDTLFPSFESQQIPPTIRTRTPIALCNHCNNPPCARVCPTKATWRRSDGIVMIDWHRCIGCRYCAVACPYGSRSFNWVNPRPQISTPSPDFPTRTQGVIEKCTFCAERLARDLKPVCVEACKYGALTFDDITDPHSLASSIVSAKFTIRRKPEMSTGPQIY